MMLKDCYGNTTSAASSEALEKYNEALEMLRLFRGDPVAKLDEAIALDPRFGGAWAARAGALAHVADRAYAAETQKSFRGAAGSRLTERERAFLAASQDWFDGQITQATLRLARSAREHPRDLLTAQHAHLGCYYLGMSHEMRDWPLQTLHAFDPDEPGHGALLAMAGFGFEESGEYARAEEFGHEALRLEPRDRWAVHAVAHVYEMRGDAAVGIPWIEGSADDWGGPGTLAGHIWWHVALLYFDRGEYGKAVQLYDRRVRPDDAGQIVLEWVDGAALLWRLRLEGIDTGTRFEKLAHCWERAMEDSISAFNDVHAVMAFIGADRMDDAERTLAAMRATAAHDGDNGHMTRAIGIPLAEALLAFDAGRYTECIDKIADVRGIASRFGGSHAQRDIFSLTALYAAIRGGLRNNAMAFASERTMHKPHSLWAESLMRQARSIPAG